MDQIMPTTSGLGITTTTTTTDETMLDSDDQHSISSDESSFTVYALGTVLGMTAKELNEGIPGENKLEWLAKQLTADYESSTGKIIAKRPGAKVYDTIFAAIIQAWLIINGDGTKLLWVSKKNTDEVAAARAALEALKRKGDRVTNAQTIQLWRAWGLFVILIERAESLNLRVFDDDAYGRPQSVTWIEFVGIVSYLAANIMQCITDAETAAKGGALSLSVYTILQDISRIRRYYRSKMDGSGARRNQHDWNIIYSFLEKIDDPAVNIDNEIGTNVMDGLAFGPEPDLGF